MYLKVCIQQHKLFCLRTCLMFVDFSLSIKKTPAIAEMPQIIAIAMQFFIVLKPAMTSDLSFWCLIQNTYNSHC